MELTNYQVTIAIFMLAVTIVMVGWFLRNKAALSRQRRTRMMKQMGLDPEAADQKTLASLKAVTARCTVCNCEDYCERWLAGEVGGSNEFCPNAQTFEELKRGAAPEPIKPTVANAL